MQSKPEFLFRSHKTSVSSVALKADGTPVLLLEISDAANKARVSSFELLQKVLEVSGEQKLSEIQSMLQICKDPVGQIFGVSGDSKALLESFDTFNNETDAHKKEQCAKLYKLLIVINSFDLQLMSAAVKGVAKAKYLDISKVTDEIEMLKAFCGPEAKNALIKIDWDIGKFR
jgi:uncharacterized tellurite resistance protein B-like protein